MVHPQLAIARILAPLACCLCCFARNPLQLPIEVAGAAGTEAAVTLDIPAASANQVRSLWMQIHGLEYAGMISVQINQGPWTMLNNETALVAGPGRSYGGIGGGFATLKLTLPIPPGCVVDSSNTVRFRFNGANRVVSGFRVLALNLLARDGRALLPQDSFVEENPATWMPPLNDAESIAAGAALWHSAKLVASALPDASAIRAHCADCHARDGRDLKYFNFSNVSIVARSRFHGLSDLQGRQIASYIRSLAVPNPGRPWNPPYQPGPGLDNQLAITNRAAGAGLARVLDKDTDTLAFLFSGASPSPAVFNPDGHLNAREIPIALQLPDWNHWLPRVHPLDAWGEHFETSAFSQLYSTGLTSTDDIPGFFSKWSKARNKFLPHLEPASTKWSPELAETLYSAQLWQLVKTWEIVQERGLDGSPWQNTIPAATAPTELNIPDGPAGMGGSGLTNEYYSNAWYQLQVLLNDGNHRHRGKLPIDWPYLIGHFLDLQRLSGRPESGRLLVMLIRAMQSTDPHAGPENITEGWRPEQNLDPRIMVDAAWAPMFASLPPDLRRVITESLLAAWLDKTMQYSPASYFKLGLSASAYSAPIGLQNIYGGKVWQAETQFQAAGVKSDLLQRVQDWGQIYTKVAELFHY